MLIFISSGECGLELRSVSSGVKGHHSVISLNNPSLGYSGLCFHAPLIIALHELTTLYYTLSMVMKSQESTGDSLSKSNLLSFTCF